METEADILVALVMMRTFPIESPSARISPNSPLVLPYDFTPVMVSGICCRDARLVLVAHAGLKAVEPAQ